MDHTYARNLWRKRFVERSEGKFTAKDFDEWFPEIAATGTLQDYAMVAFIEMLHACAAGVFGEAPGRD